MKTQIPIANIYYLLSYAWDCVAYEDDQFLSTDTYTCPEDFWCKVIDFSIQRLRARGLRKQYLSTAESIPGIKGKLLLNESLKTGDIFKGRAFCEFDEYTKDHKINQIIKATLLSLLRSMQISNKNIKVLKHNLTFFTDVTPVHLGQKIFQNLPLNAHNKHYSLILNLCSLIFNNLSLSERPESLMRDFLSDEVQMHLIFEKFVRNFYRAELKVPGVKIGSKKYNWETTDGDDLFKSRIPTLSTDTTIKSESKTIIIDTKFYARALVSNWGPEKYIRSHLSQIMDYMRSAAKDSPTPTYGMLLYPTVDLPINDVGTVEGLRIKIASINLMADWKDIHKNLLLLIENFETNKIKAA